MKNAFYVIIFIVVMTVAPTLLRLLGVPPYDVVLSNVFGDNKIMAIAFSIALVALIIFVVYKSIQKHIVQ